MDYMNRQGMDVAPQRRVASAPPPPPSPRRSSRGLIVFMVLLVLVFAGIAGYFYYTSKGGTFSLLNSITTGKGTEAEAEAVDADALVLEVGKIIVLPTNEKPTVATVTDVEKLKAQPFFANAKEGYRVLIYTESKKAILYDPVAKKIVEVGSLNISK